MAAVQLPNAVVTSSTGRLTPNPVAPIYTPSDIAPISDSELLDPLLLSALTPNDIAAPVVVTPESIASLGLPVVANSISAGTVSVPMLVSSVAVGLIGIPAIVTPESVAAQDAPVIVTPESVAPIIDPVIVPSVSTVALLTPVQIAANALDPTTPPFALNHARILYDNLAVNSAVTVSSGTNGSYVLIPNTFQAWGFTATQNIILTLPANQNIDTICIGAHNLSGAVIAVDVDPVIAGTFASFATDKSPDTNDAIMFHVGTAVSTRRIRITITGAGSYKIGWITAGLALQMARPFFAGHNPMSQNKKHRYYDAWTETGQMVGRSTRSVQLECDYSWENLPDAWYRSYMPAFIQSATQLPYVIAWNLLEYPDDVAMAFTDEDISSSYSGTRNLRSVSFSARGIA